MDFLRAGELLTILQNYKKTMAPEEFNNLCIILGDDEELNGVHPSYYLTLVKKTDEEFSYFNEDLDYIKENKYILLS